jgi:hypothetical protein
MSRRGRKTDRDWLNNPTGEVPPITSLLYSDEHFIWDLLELPEDSNQLREVKISCSHCDFTTRCPAIKYNSTTNLFTHLRNKHPEIAKEVKGKEEKKRAT